MATIIGDTLTATARVVSVHLDPERTVTVDGQAAPDPAWCATYAWGLDVAPETLLAETARLAAVDLARLQAAEAQEPEESLVGQSL